MNRAMNKDLPPDLRLTQAAWEAIETPNIPIANLGFNPSDVKAIQELVDIFTTEINKHYLRV